MIDVFSIIPVIIGFISDILIFRLIIPQFYIEELLLSYCENITCHIFTSKFIILAYFFSIYIFMCILISIGWKDCYVQHIPLFRILYIFIINKRNVKENLISKIISFVLNIGFFIISIIIMISYKSITNYEIKEEYILSILQICFNIISLFWSLYNLIRYVINKKYQKL